MRAGTKKVEARRRPKQRRARQTVEAVLDAVVKILRGGGLDRVTTNRIAQVAGVSIGSVYQYFPDKRAIFTALHDRHVEEISRVVESRLVDHAGSSLEEFVRALVEALVDAHASDPELHELLATEVPHGAGGKRAFTGRLRGAFRLAISCRSENRAGHDLERAPFVLAHMVEALCHGAVLQRPRTVSLAAAKEEAVRAVLAYLRS